MARRKRKNSQNSNVNSESSYKYSNAYQKKLVPQQVVTFLLFIVHFILHSVFLPKAIIQINQIVLFFLWALFYICIVFVGVDYFYITCTDPVDRYLLNQNEAEKIFHKKRAYNERYGSSEDVDSNPYKLKYCMICKKLVGMKSYHCLRCQRCCEGFDHHCKFLNTCIGSKNYYEFFRLLLTSTLYFIFSLGQCIWVFIQANQNQKIQEAAINKWVVIGILGYGFLLMIIIDILLVFHIYISCCRHMSTLQYLYRKTPSNKATEQNEKAHSTDEINKDMHNM